MSCAVQSGRLRDEASADRYRYRAGHGVTLLVFAVALLPSRPGRQRQRVGSVQLDAQVTQQPTPSAHALGVNVTLCRGLRLHVGRSPLVADHCNIVALSELQPPA